MTQILGLKHVKTTHQDGFCTTNSKRSQIKSKIAKIKCGKKGRGETTRSLELLMPKVTFDVKPPTWLL